jgi:hypothetical protein
MLIPAAFLYVGYQTVTGKAKDTLGNSIGSIGLGLLQFVGAALIGLGGAGVFGRGGAFGGGQQELLIVIAAVIAVFGSMLVGAGALALMGRKAYKEWRGEQGYDRPRRRRRRRDRDEDRDDRDDE